MSHMSDRDIKRRNLEETLGTDSITEAELLALEERHDRLLAGAKRIRYHLTECEQGDARTLADFDELLSYVGILDQVVPEPVSQPAGEMSCHNCED